MRRECPRAIAKCDLKSKNKMREAISWNFEACNIEKDEVI